MVVCLLKVPPEHSGWLYEFDQLPAVGERLELSPFSVGPLVTYNVMAVRKSARFGVIVDLAPDQEGGRRPTSLPATASFTPKVLC
jgi:hypothetical protein